MTSTESTTVEARLVELERRFADLIAQRERESGGGNVRMHPSTDTDCAGCRSLRREVDALSNTVLGRLSDLHEAIDEAASEGMLPPAVGINPSRGSRRASSSDHGGSGTSPTTIRASARSVLVPTSRDAAQLSAASDRRQGSVDASCTSAVPQKKRASPNPFVGQRVSPNPFSSRPVPSTANARPRGANRSGSEDVPESSTDTAQQHEDNEETRRMTASAPSFDLIDFLTRIDTSARNAAASLSATNHEQQLHRFTNLAGRRRGSSSSQVEDDDGDALTEKLGATNNAAGHSNMDVRIADLERPRTPSVNPSGESRTGTKRILSYVEGGSLGKNRGMSERAPLIVGIDVLFATVSCALCFKVLYLIHPNSDAADLRVVDLSINAVSQLATIVWVISRFFLAKRKGEWEVIDDLPTIRKRYLHTWFGYDLIYAVPIDFIFVVWNWEAYRWSQLRHFLRLARIFNLGNSHNPLLSTRLWFRFMSFALFTITIIGGSAAVFWLFESQYTFEQSLYWAIATMTSVGYGDVVPSRMDSRLYVCFAMFLGIAALSTMTAFATSFLTEKDALEAESEAKKKMMYSMLNYYDVPWDVQKEVITAMPSMLEAEHQLRFKDMMTNMPEFVSNKIEGYMRVRMLSGVPLFKGLKQNAALVLAESLKQLFCPAGHVVIRQGSLGTDMFFLRHGVVHVIIDDDVALWDSDDDSDGGKQKEIYGDVVAALHAGSFFGEVELLRDTPRRASVTAVTLCELLSLSRQAFLDFVIKFPECAGTLREQLLASEAFSDMKQSGTLVNVDQFELSAEHQRGSLSRNVLESRSVFTPEPSNE